MLRHRFLSRFFPALLLLAAGMSAHAATVIYCVGNAQQFSQALSAAANSTSNISIRLRQGEYDAFAASLPFRFTAIHSNQTVEISGGWQGANNTCQASTPDPTLTRIIGTQSDIALSLSTGFSNGTSGNQLQLHDVSISNPNFTAANNGACLYASVNQTSQMSLERVHLQGCVATAGAFASAFLSNNGGLLTVRNVAAWNSLAKHSGGIGLTTYNGGTSHLAQISVTNAKSSSGNASLNAGLLISTPDPTSIITLSNTVSWNNGGYIDPWGDTVLVSDIFVSGSGISLTRVHRGSLYGSPLSDIGASTGDPGFVNATNPHLRGDSLLVDTGVTNPDGGSGTLDADGNTRVKGAAVDVGAFERDPELIFRNGFD